MSKAELLRSCVDVISEVEGIEDRKHLLNVLKDKSFSELVEELEFYTEMLYK